jgi:chromosome segregation ATPase
MKIHIILAGAIGVILTSVGLSGCASKPIDELKMVNSAMELARNSQAPEYEPLDWDRARMQWEEANALIQMGKYNEARDVLAMAVTSYNAARDKSDRRVESLKIEIKALQSSIDSELTKLEHDIEAAKAKPETKRRVEEALPRIDEKISVMNADFGEKEYLRSRMTGQEITRYMQDLEAKLGVRP